MRKADHMKSLRQGALWGGFVGDALAMPVHWYYDRQAMHRDYGVITKYRGPVSPHPDSILWRSSYTPLNAKADILHGQAAYWGQRGVHYHQHLSPGDNTLNLQLVMLMLRSLKEQGGYDADDYLERYRTFMLTPGSHQDTYVEECHRHFFTHYARGRKLRACGSNDNHIGGLAAVPALMAVTSEPLEATLKNVRLHVSLTHTHPDVLRAADSLTRVLWHVLRGQELREGIEKHATEHFSARRARTWIKRGDDEILGSVFSTACYIQEAFPATLYLAWKYAHELPHALISNTQLGGDNCHRGVVLGGLLGASLGREAFPEKWLADLKLSPHLRQVSLPMACA